MSKENRSAPARLFGNLKVRLKLIVLHNLFFLVLAGAAYFSLIPLFEGQIQDAQRREVRLMEEASKNGVKAQILTDAIKTEQSYDLALRRAKFTLFLVLGIIYILAVLALEAVIMPLYVYQPLRRLLDADTATQAGDRDRELIPESAILSDEIGQIMRSRNAAVSSLRHQEDELASALRRLEEQDRLVSLGMLSASVAHELNTPLAVLNGSIEKLIETSTDPQTLDRLHRMQRVAQRLRRISEGLLDFARTRKQHMEPAAVRPLIEEAWSLVAIDEKAAGVEFRNLVQAEDRVIGNSDRLVQVFVNLLRNAVNAVEAVQSPGSGAQRGSEGMLCGQIRASSRRQNHLGEPGIVITIDDDGAGIPADVLPDIFDAFVTSRLDARGTGLGLTVAEGIITQHSGTIAASNRAEGGARLEVWLPAARS